MSCLICVLAGATSCLTTVAGAATSGVSRAGSLDRSFGRSGIAETPKGSAHGSGIQIEVLADSEAVVAEPYGGRFLRLHPDGSVEKRYGDGGIVALHSKATALGRRLRTFASVSVGVDSRGRVLIFGTKTDSSQTVPVPGNTVTSFSASRAAVLRLDRHGHLDPTFGGGRGLVSGDFGLVSPLSPDVPLVGAMNGVVDSMDRLVLVAGVFTVSAGCYGHTSFDELPRAVVRLTADGKPDPGFGADGVSPLEGTLRSPGLVVDGTGSVAVEAGPTMNCGIGGRIYGLDAGGRPLEGFGTDGVLESTYHLQTLEPSGRLIVFRQDGSELELSRLETDGSLDPTFGVDGVVSIRLPVRAGGRITSVLVDGSGRILLAGYAPMVTKTHQRSAFLLARLSADGRIERSFGHRGWTITRLPPSVRLVSAQAALDREGRLLIAGVETSREDPLGRFVVARYLSGR